MNNKKNEEFITSLQTSGYIFKGSQIYGGLANSWDYGPLGVLLARNIKNLWWNHFITKDVNNFGLDSAIFMNSKVWKSSGHIDNFNDPLFDCKNCRSRFRADKILEKHNHDVNWESFSNEALTAKIKEEKIICPKCKSNDFTDVRNFHLMFSTQMGIVEGAKSEIFLRPETAQGIFINFKNVYRAMRKKLPIGVGQIGKAFRNEITPGNFIFRMREFEQMELEFFCKKVNVNNWYNHYIEKAYNFLIEILKINSEKIRIRKHAQDELAHYSSKTSDIEFNFNFGWGELWGIAHRGNFDLQQHQDNSEEDLFYYDQLTNQKILPEIIEPSVGVDRLILATLTNAYKIEKIDSTKERTVLKLAYDLAPYKVAVFPLSKKISDSAFKLYQKILNLGISATFDETASIGKRYRRQDSIGTFWGLTFDFNSLEDQQVTLRHRDTMEQIRIPIKDIEKFLLKDHF